MLGVVSSSVVRPSAVAGVVSALVFHASPRQSISAAAQHAAVADAALRPRDRRVFERWKHTNAFPIYRCGAAKRQSVRRPGRVVGIPFSDPMSRIVLPERRLCRPRRAGASCAGVVRRPVVLLARCASVVRTPVVLKARYRKRDSRGAWFRSRSVVPRVIVCWACSQPNARRAGVVPGWCGRWVRLTTRTTAAGAPNTPMQPTASRARSLAF
jgi:hypothetical protein